ncbi:mpv17-like protein [Oncorhynchus kisutch]|uniref:MPV17 mitochondrial inner membrane protein like n=1 Tax=Oncorhynchus kisutch TaxID=8019 RepID=A0A8C7JBU9_ONCKI|nr:mpv17-like protein [Oncorhynchus kisutch]
MRRAFIKHVKRFPWLTNVTLYGCLFAGGDFVHQLFSRNEKMDWRHTRNVAVVAFSFHGNFNFFWMRFLERRFPGNSVRMVVRKLFLDQTTAAPLATSVFYTGVSFLEGKEDIFQDWREKFLNTYKTGLMFWPFMQFLNFSMVPLYMRTTFTGCCAFVWATFLCFSRQSGDGTANAALAWMFTPKQDTTTEPEAEKLGPKVDQTGTKVDREGPKPENPSPKEETQTLTVKQDDQAQTKEVEASLNKGAQTDTTPIQEKGPHTSTDST